jgi:HEAT repeat protein
MWENMLRVDWARLSHAYGYARNVPEILRQIIAPEDKARDEGWNGFCGVVNHQGDFYDSTVAAIPFLVEAVDRPEVPDRTRILNYFRKRWLDAPQYGGDPVLAEPPGGVDEPTPLLTDAQIAATQQARDEGDEKEDDEEFDIDRYRRMDLCAWQTGRAIQAGRPTFERLLEDPDWEVAAAAAELLLLWPESRGRGKRTLIRTIADEPHAVEQARRILEFGIYANAEDVTALAQWVLPQRPAEMRAAAALAWAWVVNPLPLPEQAAVALRDTTVRDAGAFARLPREGIYHRGPSSLPANAAALVFRLAENNDQELRWWAVASLAAGTETVQHLSPTEVVRALIRRLSDGYHQVRQAAAFILSRRGEAVLEMAPDVVPALVHALEDTSPSVCGHAAWLLAINSNRLTPAQREEGLAGVDRAIGRFAGKEDSYVFFDDTSIGAKGFLERQRGPLLKPIDWGVSELLAAFFTRHAQAFRRSSPEECDRRLAEAYKQAPQQTIAAAVTVLRNANDDTAASGAALWLRTLGPAAEPALEALNATMKEHVDDNLGALARITGQFIRSALRVTPESSAATTSTSDALSTRNRIALLRRALRENKLSAPEQAALVPELIESLEDPDAYVRAGSAELLGKLAPAVPHVSHAIPALKKMLVDADAAEVGIAESFPCGEQLYHWRRERRCPRDAAVRSLFAIGLVSEDDRILTAMVAESMHAAVICGIHALPHLFTIAQWRRAIAAAGGLSVADPLIRAARQQCLNQSRSGNDPDSADACEAELTEVIRQLFGRLV